MEKTIYKGDTFLCDVNAYRSKPPTRGDVIVFQHEDTVLVKRLIGLPGDRVEGKDGVITVNGIALVEPYVEHIGPVTDRWNTFGPTTVPPGLLFVLGDNRDNSFDSRMEAFGDVNLSDVVGKAISIVRSEHQETGHPIRGVNHHDRIPQLREVTMASLATDFDIDWMACELIESVPRKVSGKPVVRGTRIMPDAIAGSYELAETIEELCEGLPTCPKRRLNGRSSSLISSKLDPTPA